MIKVLFFANLRDAAQTNAIDIDAESIENVRDLVAELGRQLPPAFSDALQDETAMISIDHQYADWGAELHDGAEVGFLPPVSGG